MVDVASRELESKIAIDLSEFKQEILDADLQVIRNEIEMIAKAENLLEFEPPKWHIEARTVPADFVSKLQQIEQELANEEKKATETLKKSNEAPAREKSKERETLTSSRGDDRPRSGSPASNSNERYTPKSRSRSPDRDYPREPYPRHERDNYRREWYPRDYHNYERDTRERNERDYYEPPYGGSYRPRDKYPRGDERYRPYDNTRDRFPRERREFYKDYSYNKDYNNYKDYNKDYNKDNYRDNSGYNNKDYNTRDNTREYKEYDKDNYQREGNYNKDSYKDYGKDNYNKDNNYPREPEKDYQPRDRPPYDRR